MAEKKKYFWLKLHDNFFASLPVKKLRRIAGGDTYTIIYLEMLLISLKNEGIIEFEGVESNLCEELSLALNEQEDDVSVTVQFLLKHGLAEMTEGDSLLLPEAVLNTGSEGASAERMRKLRGKASVQCLSAVTSSAQSDASPSQCDKPVTERKRESNIKNNSESNSQNTKSFVPPSIEDVKAYCAERQSSVDPVRFWEYFNAGGWKDSKGQPVRNWKQKLITWESHDGEHRKNTIGGTLRTSEDYAKDREECF